MEHIKYMHTIHWLIADIVAVTLALAYCVFLIVLPLIHNLQTLKKEATEHDEYLAVLTAEYQTAQNEIAARGESCKRLDTSLSTLEQLFAKSQAETQEVYNLLTVTAKAKLNQKKQVAMKPKTLPTDKQTGPKQAIPKQAGHDLP